MPASVFGPCPRKAGQAEGGSSAPRRIAPGDDIQFPSGWTPDGANLAYTVSSIATGYDIWISNVMKGTSRSFLASTFNEYGAVFAPDGKWVAYVSDETGREEVYLRSYPEGTLQLQVSTGGGTNPLWAPGGGQLYYRRGTDLLAVDVVAGQVLPASARVSIAGILSPGSLTPVPDFDVQPRGGVVLASEDKRTLPTRLRVITGWLREVGERLP